MQRHLDFGTSVANDGETIRSAFQKIEDNTQELYARVGGVSSINGQEGAVVLDATEIDISAFSPINYTPLNSSIEGFLQGIDAALDPLSLDQSFELETTETPINSDPINSGVYSDFECLSGSLIRLTHSDPRVGFENGSWRSALVIHHNDGDTTDYETLNYRSISDGLRVAALGFQSSGSYVQQYKDLHGVSSIAVGNIAWIPRGTAAYVGDSVQLNQGVCLGSEIGVSNPSYAVAQSGQIVGSMVNLSGKKAAADASHVNYGFLVHNLGKEATAAFNAISNGSDGDNGQYNYGLKLDQSVVSLGGIIMPQSASTHVGTRIIYDTGDYTQFNRTDNIYSWAIGSALILGLTPTQLLPFIANGVALGSTAWQWSDLFLGSGAVVNFDNGDVTLTHAAGKLTSSGVIALPNAGLQVGASVPFSDAAGTLTLQNVDALDATTAATILPASTSYTPTATPVSGTFTSHSVSGRYITRGKLTWVTMQLDITTNGTAATAIDITLPNTAARAANLVGRENGVSGALLASRINASGTTVRIYTYNNTYPGANGASIVVSGCYENT